MRLIVFCLFTVKKTKAEIAAQRVWHADKEKLRKQRREEQDRNVQRKKALAGKTKTDAVGATGEEGADDDDDDDGDDGSSEAPSEKGEGEASWDEEEEISEGEVSEDEELINDDHSSEDDDDDKPPRKKRQK